MTNENDIKCESVAVVSTLSERPCPYFCYPIGMMMMMMPRRTTSPLTPNIQVNMLLCGKGSPCQSYMPEYCFIFFLGTLSNSHLSREQAQEQMETTAIGHCGKVPQPHSCPFRWSVCFHKPDDDLSLSFHAPGTGKTGIAKAANKC